MSSLTRIDRLRRRIDEARLDGLLLSNLDNLRYLTGYTGHAAHLVVCDKGSYLQTDYRYAEIAQAECADARVIIRNRVTTTLAQGLATIFRESGLRRVGFERSVMTVGELDDLRRETEGIELVPVAGLVESLRYVKDAGEVAALRRAAEMADSALSSIVAERLKPGVSERDLALELEYCLQQAGSEGLSFETILLAGSRSSLPHGIPSDRKLASGDLLLFDFGARVEGYGSDITRTLVIGEADDQQREVYALVLDAQQAALDTLRAGIEGRVPYEASRKILEASRYAQYAGEGLGHGIGLFVHEQPMMGDGCNEVLLENCVVTIEPGIYIPGWGGVRIEDDVVVTRDGFEFLTGFPRELLQVG